MNAFIPLGCARVADSCARFARRRAPLVRLQTLRCRIRRMLAVARIEMLQLIRDPTTFSLILLVPAIQILLFGYAVNLDPRHVPIAIAGGQQRTVKRVSRTIEKTGYFTIVGDGLKPGAAARMVRQGEALIGIELPAPDHLGADASLQDPKVIVDATDPSAVRPALAALENGYWQRVAELYAIGPIPAVDVEWLYNPTGRTAWTIVPGLAGVIVMISMLMLGALTLVRERERGSWETLLATPVDAFDALVGKLSPYIILGAIQAASVIGVARLLFELPLRGDLIALLFAVPLYSAANLILGFGFSALVTSQLQAIQVAVFFYLPSMLLSGFMFPFEGMPLWARAIGEMLPLTHFVRATRSVLLKGEGASVVVSEMWPVGLFTLLATTLALLAYRRRVD
jgi:ABC-2 type transport system permease protein